MKRWLRRYGFLIFSASSRTSNAFSWPSLKTGCYGVAQSGTFQMKRFPTS